LFQISSPGEERREALAEDGRVYFGTEISVLIYQSPSRRC